MPWLLHFTSSQGPTTPIGISGPNRQEVQDQMPAEGMRTYRYWGAPPPPRLPPRGGARMATSHHLREWASATHATPPPPGGWLGWQPRPFLREAKIQAWFQNWTQLEQKVSYCRVTDGATVRAPSDTVVSRFTGFEEFFGTALLVLHTTVTLERNHQELRVQSWHRHRHMLATPFVLQNCCW